MTTMPERVIEPPITMYPSEHVHVRYGFLASLCFHLLVIGIVLLLAWIFRVRSLRDLIVGTVPPPPPAAVQIEVELDDKIPPPPTDHPEFIIQKMMVPPPPPPPIVKPKPKPKPTPPHKAAPTIVSHAPPGPVEQAQITAGTGNFPYPEYPREARLAQMQGTVLIKLEFDGSGKAVVADVLKSSGHSVLDRAASSFILDNWRDPAFANRSGSVPIVYRLQ